MLGMEPKSLEDLEPAERTRSRLARAFFRLEMAELERIWAITAAHHQGLSVRDIARHVGLGPTRVHQLLTKPQAGILDQARAALKEAGWPAPEFPGAGGPQVPDRLAEAAELLTSCAGWLGSQPAGEPGKADLADAGGRERIAQVLLGIAGELEALSPGPAEAEHPGSGEESPPGPAQPPEVPPAGGLANPGLFPDRAPLGPRYTLVDVAKAAGVSYQTVSRVLNNLPDVSPATRERVLTAIEELGYRRNLSARALKTRRFTTFGIITDGSPRYGPVGTLIALERAARDAGYSSTVITVREPYQRSVPAALGGLEESGVDGIIAITPRLGFATAIRENRVRVPVIMLAAGEASMPGIFTYSEDQERGARKATRHLLDLGHTDIAHLAGSMDWFDGRVRKRGWELEMREAGLEPGRCLEGDWTPRWAYRTGLRLVSEGLPAAIFAASDHVALGLFRAFTERGVRVPDDVSVVGFDDIEGADFFSPPLTTIRQDFAALAQRSIHLLICALEGREADLTPIVEVLKLRNSTRPARG